MLRPAADGSLQVPRRPQHDVSSQPRLLPMPPVPCRRSCILALAAPRSSAATISTQSNIPSAPLPCVQVPAGKEGTWVVRGTACTQGNSVNSPVGVADSPLGYSHRPSATLQGLPSHTSPSFVSLSHWQAVTIGILVAQLINYGGCCACCAGGALRAEQLHLSLPRPACTAQRSSATPGRLPTAPRCLNALHTASPRLVPSP